MLPMSIGSILIWIVVIAAGVALMYVALSQFGIGIPLWVQRVFWIVVVACVVVFAIRFLMSM